MAEPTVAAGVARGLLQLAVSKGASRDLLLARSAINPQTLADQDNRVPFANYVALMRVGKELTGDPALALHFGEAFDMAQLSIVGLIGDACESGTEAMAQINRYARLVVEVDLGGGDRFQLQQERADLFMVDTRKNPNEFPELTESTFARVFATSRRALGEVRFVKAVHVTHPTPFYRAEYERIFQAPVIFDADKNALAIDPAMMVDKTPLPSRYIFGILSERADALLRSLEASKSTRGRVESLLMPILHMGDCSMDLIAGKLGLSRQTLYRNLKAEVLVNRGWVAASLGVVFGTILLLSLLFQLCLAPLIVVGYTLQCKSCGRPLFDPSSVPRRKWLGWLPGQRLVEVSVRMIRSGGKCFACGSTP